jgi:hypothetical protein
MFTVLMNVMCLPHGVCHPRLPAVRFFVAWANDNRALQSACVFKKSTSTVKHNNFFIL